MILASIQDYPRYEGLHPLFKQAFEFLQSTDFDQLEDGRIELEGTRLYANVCTLVGKPKEEALLETHQQYIDIQMPLLGVEKIGFKPLAEVTETSKPYNEADDITFYADRPSAFTKIHPGQFAVYFPEDAHAPGIGKTGIRKVIVKVRID